VEERCWWEEGLEEKAGLECRGLDAAGVIRARRAPGVAAGWRLVRRSLETSPVPPEESPN